MNRRQIAALENRFRAPGKCPECGRRTGEQRITTAMLRDGRALVLLQQAFAADKPLSLAMTRT